MNIKLVAMKYEIITPGEFWVSCFTFQQQKKQFIPKTINWLIGNVVTKRERPAARAQSATKLLEFHLIKFYKVKYKVKEKSKDNVKVKYII